jgi:RHS repeat-associated protein
MSFSRLSSLTAFHRWAMLGMLLAAASPVMALEGAVGVTKVCLNGSASVSDCNCGGKDSVQVCVKGRSTINLLNLTYTHDAWDYRVSDPGTTGCAPCGGTQAGQAGQIPRPLALHRTMKFRNTWIRGSLGAGAYLDTDVMLWLSRTNPDGSGRIIRYSPEAFGETWFWDAGPKVDDTTVDGVYHDEINITVDLRLFDAAGALVVDQNQAVRAILTQADGDRQIYEIIQTSDDPAADRQGRLVRWEDRNGNGITVSYQYPRDAVITGWRDVLWRQTAISDDAGRTATITIDTSNGKIRTITLPGGGVLTYTQDADRNLIRVDHPDDSLSTFGRRQDVASQSTVIDIDDPAAGTTHRRKSVFVANAVWVDPVTNEILNQPAGFLRKVLGGTGEVVFEAAFDAERSDTKYVFTGGNQWRRLVCPNGNQPLIEDAVREVSPTGSATWRVTDSAVRNARKQVTSQVDEAGRRTQRVFVPGTYHIANQTNPDGTTRSTTWNAFGEPLVETDELGRVTVSTYDERGNRLSRTEGHGTPEAATWTWTYNARGQVLTATDPRTNPATITAALPGATKAYVYDAAGHLVAITEPPDALDVPNAPRATTTFTYDARGRRVSMTQPIGEHGQTTTYTWDTLNRLTCITYPDTSTETFTYASSGADAGLLIEKTDRNGNRERCVYDGDGREIACTRAFGTTAAVTRTTTYLSGTNLPTVIEEAGERTVMTYDNRNRVVATTRVPAIGRSLTSTQVYDATGAAVSTDPYGRRSITVRDDRNRPVRSVQELVPGPLSDAAIATSWSADATMTLLPLGTPATAPSMTPGPNGSFTLTGSGWFWGSSDVGTWYARTAYGDVDLVVRLDSTSNATEWSKPGLMIRASDAADAANVLVIANNTHGMIMQCRATTGGTTSGIYTGPTGSTTVPATWLRLRRQGNVIEALSSPDGETWTSNGTVTINLPTVVRAGLAINGNSGGTPETAVFSNLSIAVPADNPTAHPELALPRFAAGLSRSTAGSDLVITDTVYDAAGQVIERIDGRGYRTTFAYDQRGRLISQTEAVGHAEATTGIGYDAAGNRTRVTSPRGIETRMTYTGRNLLADVTEDATASAVRTRLLTYTPTRKVKTETDALDRTTIYTYGGCCDRLRAITDPDDFTTTFAYDAKGNRTVVTDPNENATVTVYDARDRVVSVTNAATETTSFLYDDVLGDGVQGPASAALTTVQTLVGTLGLGGVAGGDGSVAFVRAPGTTAQTTDDEITAELRDGLGRTVARVNALGHATIAAYDTVTAGLVETTQTDAVGHVTRAHADGAGRVRQQVDALGNTSVATFDANGNQLSQRDALGIGWDATYDSRNRLFTRTTTRVGAMSEEFAYDLDGNQAGSIRMDGVTPISTETSVYDARNRRIALIDRLGGITRFGYDLVGNLISISDADNEGAVNGPAASRTTQYVYNARNLLVAEAFPEGQNGVTGDARARTLRVYTYDGARRLLSRQVGLLASAFSAAPAFAGAVTRTDYDYDDANRLERRRYEDGLHDTFAYDQSGRLTAADSARYASQVGRIYDSGGRLVSESLTLPDGQLSGQVLQSATWTVGYTYNADNTLASQTYPTGTVVARSYTNRHELAEVTMGTGPGPHPAVATRTFDAAGRLVTSQAGNNLVETRAYVAGDHRVASITVPGVTAFGYAYDPEGRKQTETNPHANGGGQTFNYDFADRLTSWTAGAAATQSWNLTKVGDWTSTTRDGVVETRTNTSVHEAIQVGPNILSYDQQGNLTKDEHGTALAWDPENRLTRAVINRDASESGFGSVAQYRYDALGRRIAKTVDGQTTLYLPAGAQTVVELTRPALPASQAAIDGVESDGTLSNQALTPASGGILAGSTVTRINFQPASVATPAGFLADKGKTADVRTNGLTYGWSSDATAQAVVRHGAVPLPEFDTHIEFAAGQSWSTTLPNGFYWVAVAAGDPLSIEQANHFDLNGTALTDPDPGTVGQVPAYEAGDFDGWVELVQVSNGTLTLNPTTNALRAKVCWLEILPAPLDGQGQPLAVPVATVQAMATLISKATAETGASPKPTNTEKEFAYLDYVDAVAAFTVSTKGGPKQRFYPHYNHLWSVAAVTSASGQVVERYTYTAYGKQTKTVMPGQVASGFGRGFTGYVADSESGYLFARSRMYSPGLGRFVGRDDYGSYRDGMSLYSAYFVPNSLDPYGWWCTPWYGTSGWEGTGDFRYSLWFPSESFDWSTRAPGTPTEWKRDKEEKFKEYTDECRWCVCENKYIPSLSYIPYRECKGKVYTGKEKWENVGVETKSEPWQAWPPLPPPVPPIGIISPPIPNFP